MIEKKYWPNGERIRQLRESQGWSQFDMELNLLNLVDSMKTEAEKEAAKCSKKTIEDAENCRHQITERKLKAMATVLGVKVEDIISPTMPQPPIAASAPQPRLLSLPGLAPPMPSLVVGRDEALRELKTRLFVSPEKQEMRRIQILTAMRGLPGVGKTTMAAALAHDADVQNTFSDGILWTSLGPKPELLSGLAAWGRALGADDLLKCHDLPEATNRLAALLRGKRVLIIVDDLGNLAMSHRLRSAVLVARCWSPRAKRQLPKPSSPQKQKFTFLGC
jgi:transcriptional regulator with XRE-family HTH domain